MLEKNNINNINDNNYEVLIVGWGPNGSLMANLLGQKGIKTLIVESSKTFTQVPKAAHLDDEGLRILKKVGLDNEILKQSYELNVKFNQSFANNSFTTIHPDTTELNFPRSIFWYQPHFEKSIRDGFQRFNSVEILTYHKVISIEKENINNIPTINESSSFSSSLSSSFSSSSSSSSSSFSTSSSCSSSPPLISSSSLNNNPINSIKILNLETNEIKNIKCKFIIGADGGNSSIRKMMKSKLEGTSGKMRWLVVDAKINKDHPPLPSYFQFVCNPSRPCLSLPIPPDHFRWEFVLFDHEDSKEMESLETINSLLIQHMADLSKLEIVRKSVYTFQNRIANHWYDGDSTLLIGDACHMIPPFLGLGVSSGFRDCQNLAWKLDLILRGIVGSPKELLYTFQTERQPNIEIITEKANQAGQIIMQTNKYKAFFRNLLLKSLLSVPPIEKLFQNKAGMKPPNIIKQGVINYKILNNEGHFDELTNHFQKIIGTQITQPYVKLLNKTQNNIDEAEISNSSQKKLLDEFLGINFSILFLNFEQQKHEKLINNLINNKLLSEELMFNFINVIGHNQHSNQFFNQQSESFIQIKDNSTESIFKFLFNKLSNNQLPPTIIIIRPDKHIFSIYNNDNLKYSTIISTLKNSLYIN
ncbi:hypothetical protein DICPUDRAFT_155178 [Dictyostelium purpureum]|uniref:FAD-binding domain-containing protein n=1 Tax=Dictyostelium purpureum TaxID=5786 RepID=F0ZTA3_DICPU|nr:uncharacterized protein DICPUDRAFT_155178 [Dictyostelium purpureum]EGC32830.1 hypothetical protein DICPUDRAFT_155178 [Dictyostelium purpureum]|eukprot:XP_003290653.1 hypothetical protein DICPUDRAFT_155178 [Dictyostelium purpureum]